MHLVTYKFGLFETAIQGMGFCTFVRFEGLEVVFSLTYNASGMEIRWQFQMSFGPLPKCDVIIIAQTSCISTYICWHLNHLKLNYTFTALWRDRHHTSQLYTRVSSQWSQEGQGESVHQGARTIQYLVW